METNDLFPCTASMMARQSYKPPTTPRLPRSVQGSRNRTSPLPQAFRAAKFVTPSFSSTMRSSGTLMSLTPVDPHQQVVSDVGVDIGAVVPYTFDDRSIDPDDDHAAQHDARVRYAGFVKDVCGKVDTFHSPSLFAEAVLREVQCRETTTDAMKVAAASWALDIISSQPGYETLRNIRNILMPAVFIDYNDSFEPRNLGGGVRSVLENTPLHAISQNPFLAYDLFAEEYFQRYQEALRSKAAQEKVEKLGLSRRQAIQNLTENMASLRQAIAFRAWRARTKFKRFDRVSRCNRETRAAEGNRITALQSSFSVWKSSVERSRSIFLSERLHNAAAQLENAKNQFQLQCFRSDKHLYTVEELRGEMQSMRIEYDTLLEQKRQLEKRLRDFDTDATNNLNHHVNSILRQLGAWRRFARRCVEGLTVHDENVKAIEDHQRASGVNFSNSDDDGGPELTPEVRDLSKTTKRQNQQPEQIFQDMNGSSEVLISWVQSIVNSAPVTPTIANVTNLSTDFQSGELMLIVLHKVFPNDVPLTPLQELNVMKRLGGLIASFVRCGVAIVPRPADFIDCNSDMIFIVLAELFSRNVQLQSLRKARELMDASYTGLDEQVLDAPIDYTHEMLPSLLDDSKQEIDGLIEQESTMRRQSGVLLKWQEMIGRDAAFATRERMSGNPVRAIGRTNVEKYWKIKVARYADLESKYRIKDEGWKEHLTKTLRRILQKHVHTTSRMFFSFSWSAVAMNEVHFWRLASLYKLGEKPLANQAVEKIFSQVAKSLGSNPDLVDGPENVVLQEITPLDFIEILIRLADAKFNAKSLPDRVDLMLQTLHKTATSTPPPTLVQTHLFNEASQRILDRYMVDIVRVFLFFAKRHPRSQNYSRLLSCVLHVDHLMQLLEEMGAIAGEGTANPFVNVNDVKSILRAVSAQEDGAISMEFSFQQFMELLGSLSGYRTPDPLVPADKKVEIIVTTMISRIRARNKGSTLIVSDVKVV